ncbi:MAG: hypothetical protein AMXMBFR33_44720 [Candidatus Xenobia bacterium]
MEEKLLLEKIHELRRRLRFVWMVNGALQWCLAGSLVTLLSIFCLKLLDRPPHELTAATLALVLFPLGGAVAAGLRKLPLMSVALATDRKLGLKERLTTGLEWSLSDRPRTVVAQRLLRDASQYAAGVDPGKTFKPRMPRSLRQAAVASLLASLLLVLPPWHLFQPRLSADEIRVVRQAAERLDQKARELRQRFPNSRQARATAQKLEDLARRLREPGTEREEAAARVASLAEQLKGQARGQGQGSAQNQGQTGMSDAREQAERLRALARRAQREGLSQGLGKDIQKEAERADPKSGQSQALKQAQKAAQQGNSQATAESLEAAAQAAAQQAAEQQEMQQEVSESLQECQSGLCKEGGPGKGNSQGQPQAGQGQQSGQAMANQPGQQPGKGGKKAPADFGKGTTNEQSANNPDGKQRDYVFDRQSKETSDWTEEYERLYASKRVHRDTADAMVKGQLTPGQMLPAQGQVRGAPRSQPGAGEGAEEVYLNYKREAEEAVTRQNVPAEYRELVRNYFDGIDPREGK